MLQVKFLKRIGYSNIDTLIDDDSAFFYEAGMQIDADGGYHAYNRDNKLGLDYLANAGRPGKWWALVTDTGKATGNPVVQKDSDPAPGYYVSTTCLEDNNVPATDPRRYLNSEAINYFVLPSNIGLSTVLGDFGVVIRPDRNDYDYAIYGDKGPVGKIGEGSIALASALNVPSNPKTGGIGHGILYIVFPGSSKGWCSNQVQIDQHGATLFAKWGGLNKAKECFPSAPWQQNATVIEIATAA